MTETAMSTTFTPSDEHRRSPEQSAALPYRVGRGRVEVLLVTSRSRGRWILPKGNVEAEMGGPRTAVREAFEEAGVRGDAEADAFGRYRHDTEEGARLVEVFLLEVEDVLPRWPEDHERRRRWVPVHEAHRHVDVEGLRPLLHRAAARLAAYSGTNPKSS